MLFHWSLNDSKSPADSRTLFSILADLNNALVSMVSIRPLISKFSNPCTFGDSTKRVNYNWNHRHFHVLQFVSVLFQDTYLSFCFPSVLLCRQPEQQSSLSGRFFFFKLLLVLVDWSKLDDPFEFWASHFLGLILGYAYIICHTNFNIWFFIEVWVTQLLSGPELFPYSKWFYNSCGLDGIYSYLAP